MHTKTKTKKVKDDQYEIYWNQDGFAWVTGPVNTHGATNVLFRFKAASFELAWEIGCAWLLDNTK